MGKFNKATIASIIAVIATLAPSFLGFEIGADVQTAIVTVIMFILGFVGTYQVANK